jgi:hypothetical protein
MALGASYNRNPRGMARLYHAGAGCPRQPYVSYGINDFTVCSETKAIRNFFVGEPRSDQRNQLLLAPRQSQLLLLLSLNAACATSPCGNHWHALVFIGKSSEFMARSCGAAVQIANPLVGRRKGFAIPPPYRKKQKSQVALRRCLTTTGVNVSKSPYQDTGKSHSGTKPRFGTTTFFLRFLHQHRSPL